MLTERLTRCGETWAEVEAVSHGDDCLDEEWVYGFHELDNPPTIVAWTAHRIYFTFEHAGFGDAASLPRHPDAVCGDVKGVDEAQPTANASQWPVDRAHTWRSAFGTDETPAGDSDESRVGASVPVVAVSMATVRAKEVRVYGHSARSRPGARCPGAGDRVFVDWGSRRRRSPATIARVRPTGTLVLVVDPPAAQRE